MDQKQNKILFFAPVIVVFIIFLIAVIMFFYLYYNSSYNEIFSIKKYDNLNIYYFRKRKVRKITRLILTFYNLDFDSYNHIINAILIEKFNNIIFLSKENLHEYNEQIKEGLEVLFIENGDCTLENITKYLFFVISEYFKKKILSITVKEEKEQYSFGTKPISNYNLNMR